MWLDLYALSILEHSTVSHPGEINGAYTRYCNVKETGQAYGVGDSALTRASRGVVLEMEGSQSFRKAVGLLVQKLEV